MLQTLEKCEVKAHSVEIQEFNCHPILREINFGKIWSTKIAFFYKLRDSKNWILVNLGLEKRLKFTNTQIQNL